jgi:predicted DNA binding protein
MRYRRRRISAAGREDELHPMDDLLANGTCVDRGKITHWTVSGDDLGIMHFVTGDAAAFETALDDIDAVREYELPRVDEERGYVYLRSTLTDGAGALFRTLTQGTLVVIHPVTWHGDGTQSIRMIGSTDEIQRVIDGRPAPVECQVAALGGLEWATSAARSTLSDRQQEALESALSLGDYETPRAASVEAVATDIGCARRTAAEHLRKMESRDLHAVFRGAADRTGVG